MSCTLYFLIVIIPLNSDLPVCYSLSFSANLYKTAAALFHELGEHSLGQRHIPSADFISCWGVAAWEVI